MPLNPFKIASQRQGEDRLTYALACALEACGPAALADLLTELEPELLLTLNSLKVELQTAGPDTRPDARFTCGEDLVVLFESKIKANTLGKRQLKGHVALFGSALKSAARILLVVAPDPQAPAWLEGLSGDQAQVVYGSWQQVGEWALRQARMHSYEESGCMLLEACAELGAELNVVDLRNDCFEPKGVALLEDHAHAVRTASRHQERAQERFLSGVLESLSEALSERGLQDRVGEGRIFSRGVDPNCFVPVSSVLEGAYNNSGLSGWPTVRIWAEVYLRSNESRGRLSMRSGLILQGVPVVSAWFGHAQAQAQAAFPDRYSRYSYRTRYAEVWCIQPFDVENETEMARILEQDLLTWISTVIPGLQAIQAESPGGHHPS